MIDSIKTCFSKYATFDGRANRSEFWWFYLFVVVVNVLLTVLVSGIAGSSMDVTSAFTNPAGFFTGLGALGALPTIWALATLIPVLAVGCRRLHDSGKSGWFQLLLLVPCGNIAVLILWLLGSTPGDNRFGTPDTA